MMGFVKKLCKEVFVLLTYPLRKDFEFGALVGILFCWIYSMYVIPINFGTVFGAYMGMILAGLLIKLIEGKKDSIESIEIFEVDSK